MNVNFDYCCYISGSVEPSSLGGSTEDSGDLDVRTVASPETTSPQLANQEVPEIISGRHIYKEFEILTKLH